MFTKCLEYFFCIFYIRYAYNNLSLIGFVEFELSEFELSEFELSEFEMSEFELSEFELSEFKL